MKKVALLLGIVCCLVTAAIFIQIKTVQSITNDEGISLNDNAELKDEVLKWRQAYKNVYAQLESIEERLEQARTEAATNSGYDKNIENQIKKNNELLGLTEIKGQGVIIYLDENRDVNAREVLDISSYLVHEGDLLNIINELYNAGADAISINGKRIINTSSILCDGNIIRINDEIVGVPIEIKAICHPQSIYNLRRPGGYLSLMADGGVIVSVEEKDEITIPKYEGVYKYEYISSK